VPGGLPELGDAKQGRGCDENLSISTELVDRGDMSPAGFGGCQVFGGRWKGGKAAREASSGEAASGISNRAVKERTIDLCRIESVNG
jgi:hypothetical protein